jgi:hypothetical protein
VASAGGALRAVDDTQMYQSTLSLQATRVLVMPVLDLTLGLGTDLPVPRLGHNVSWEGAQVGLTLRYHWLDAPRG